MQNVKGKDVHIEYGNRGGGRVVCVGAGVCVWGGGDAIGDAMS